MKTGILMSLILFVISALLPLVSLIEPKENTAYDIPFTESAEDTAATDSVRLVSADGKKENKVSIQDYIYGCVCAEMPASFHIEAIKAQAVACYTYLMYLNKDSADREISDSSSIHQAYITDTELKEKWGAAYEVYSEKMRSAVAQVQGEYLTYEGEAALTVYHSLSPGRTYSSRDIWGKELYYLQGTTAPGDSLSEKLKAVVVLSEEEVMTALSEYNITNLKAVSAQCKADENGLVKELLLDGTVLTAYDLADLLSLSSPYFTIEEKEDSLSFTLYGKGHGIGMSQYSADYMARQGMTYDEILSHFYQGTQLVRAQ